MGNDITEFDDEEWGVPVPEAAFEELDVERFEPPRGQGDLEVAAAPRSRDGAQLPAATSLDLPIDVDVLVETLAELDDRVPYRLGGKPSSIKLDTAQFLADRKQGVDCSGFVRWLLYRSSNGRVRIPDGSWNQREHFRAIAAAAGVAPVPYAACAAQDGVLRIAGFTASKARNVKVGHIWLVVDGETGESHGHHGINRRPWDTPTLTRLVTWCYPLTL